MKAPIFKTGSYLIASLQAELTDTDLLELQEALVEQVKRFRSCGVILDVTPYGCHGLLRHAHCATSLKRLACAAPSASSWASVPRLRWPWSSWVWISDSRGYIPRWISKKRPHRRFLPACHPCRRSLCRLWRRHGRRGHRGCLRTFGGAALIVAETRSSLKAEALRRLDPQSGWKELKNGMGTALVAGRHPRARSMNT